MHLRTLNPTCFTKDDHKRAPDTHTHRFNKAEKVSPAQAGDVFTADDDCSGSGRTKTPKNVDFLNTGVQSESSPLDGSNPHTLGLQMCFGSLEG